ncbi:MAG: hypothetical protein WC242_04215 [Candidatus Paceibacterota bacterium]|jgi:hypothetical protein
MAKKVGRDPGRTVTQKVRFRVSILTRPTQSDPIPIEWDGQVIIKKSCGTHCISITLEPNPSEIVMKLVAARLNLLGHLLTSNFEVKKHEQESYYITGTFYLSTSFRFFIDACYRTFCEEIPQTNKWPHHWLDWNPRNLSVEELLRNGLPLAKDIEETYRKVTYVLCLKSYIQDSAAPHRTISRRWNLNAQNDQELQDDLGNAFGVRIKSYCKSDGIAYCGVEILPGDPMRIIPEFSGWALSAGWDWDKLLKDKELILWRVDQE